jgi:hypothetical protein
LIPGKIARLVSLVGHPLVFVLATVAIVLGARMRMAAAWPIVACLFSSVVLPTGLLLFFGVRSGRWKDADVSVREERKRFYLWAIPISAIGVVTTWLSHAPLFVLRGGIVTLGLFVLAAVINARLKISLHTLFALFCTTILFRIGLIPGLGALGLSAFVFWSRLFLGRHTAAENWVGVLIGMAGGLVAVG